MFNKEALFEMYRPKTEEIDIDGFNGLFVKQLSEREISQIRKDSGLSSEKKEGDQSNDLFGTKMIVTSIVDSDGSRVFCDGDIDRMRDCANTLIHNLTQRVLKLNGFINDEKNI
ncbi:hypothetical protein BRW83_1934 [Oxalobacter formigenes]|nr:hypothetical protein BRW83_1934 [Oxalobacter formigenes]